MRKNTTSYLLLVIWIAGVTMLRAQQSNNLILLSNWDNNNLPMTSGLVYNEVFGWADGNGREYAILGSHQRTYFIEVTNPAAPVVRDSVEGTFGGCIHRDFKTYGHYCYGVGDEGSSTLQVIDMSFLPDSVHLVLNSNQWFERAHNLFIDTLQGRMYIAGANTQWNGIIVFDIATNPASPALLASVNMGQYTHDLSVRHDTAYLNNGPNGLRVANFAVPANPVVIGALPSYPQQGYNHSSWLTPDGKHLAMADETRNISLKMVDVQNPANLGIASYFRSALLFPDSTSIPHNPLIAGQYVCVSYYHDGIQLWDIADPAHPRWAAGYDTYPTNTTYANYYGAWGCYPFLPSGTVLGSDIQNGLFVFRVPFAFPNPMGTATVVTSPTCAGSQDGAITLSPSGGTAPYTYLWSNGSTAAAPQGLAAGTYTVTVSDRYGYTFTDTVTVTAPAPILAHPQVGAETCPGTADGQIDLAPTGGSPGYGYVWSTGDMVPSLTGLTGGTYTVTITDANGCAVTDSITVAIVNPGPLAQAGQDTIICGNSLTVSATAPTSGTGHWQWAIGTGTIISPNATTTQLINLGPGSSELVWMVVDGPCAAMDTVVITLSAAVQPWAGQDFSSCVGSQSLTGSSAGTGMGMWTASSPQVSFTNAFDPHTIAGAAAPGIYQLYWTVVEGQCQGVDTVQWTVWDVPNAAFSALTTGQQVDFTNLSTSATAWSWNFGDGTTGVQQFPSHVYVFPGTYNVCLIAYGSCGIDTTCQLVTAGGLAIDVTMDSDLQLWPNPAHDQVTLHWAGANGVSAVLSDALGRSVLQATWVGEGGLLGLDGLAPGAYHVVVTAGAETRRRVLILR